MNFPINSRPRLDGLDTLRGLTLCSMLAYHACWDLVWIFGVDWSWYRSYGAYLWQQSICWTFLLLSGFCFQLGRRHLRRGLTVFVSGCLITLVTILVMPENRVWFGVLSLIGSAMLFTIPLDRFFRRVPAWTGLVCAFGCFLLTRHIGSGRVGVWKLFSVRVPDAWYLNDWTACFGFPPPNFFSTDYFPLLPWIFLFWTGCFLYLICHDSGWSVRDGDGFPPPFRWNIPPLAFMGRHSLWIYLLHQPVIYVLLTLWDNLLRR